MTADLRGKAAAWELRLAVCEGDPLQGSLRSTLIFAFLGGAHSAGAVQGSPGLAGSVSYPWVRRRAFVGIWCLGSWERRRSAHLMYVSISLYATIIAL